MPEVFPLTGQRTVVPLGFKQITLTDTPQNPNNCPRGTVQLTVDGTGPVKVDMPGATGVSIPAAVVSAHGGVLVGQFLHVYDTGTTAAGGVYAWYG